MFLDSRVLVILKRGFGLVAAATGVVTSTSLLLGAGVWSGVRVMGCYHRVTLSPNGCLPGTG